MSKAERPSTEGFDRTQLQGVKNLDLLAAIPTNVEEEAVARGIALGLEAAESISDRRISTFSRGAQPAFAGINTFLKAPYCEDIHDVGNYDVAILGEPFDMGTTYRSGCRFGPQAVRRISALYDSYNLDMAVDLAQELSICDAGDVFVIPSNIEKSFDQMDRAVSYIINEGVFPVMVGGDHSIAYPNVRAIARQTEGNIGIIHFDRHIDIQESDMDERMHTTHFFHATNLPNVPAKNLVQIGIGGWYGSRPGLKVAKDRETTVMTMGDIENLGIDKAVDAALEIAWKGVEKVYLSFDIDVVDGGMAPGTGSPEPGGLLPREALRALSRVAREGICGMEVVEIAPPYDTSDSTAQLGCRAIMDVLGTLVATGHLGSRASKPE
ncbi:MULTISPECIES: agmatinase family protein [unclassified Mycolicibacterium]|uniref:agmatinase family protein n=1 Tax=unclassified Mycolicibacterium TaxID=2636767 RepID=UPI002ED870DE